MQSQGTGSYLRYSYSVNGGLSWTEITATSGSLSGDVKGVAAGQTIDGIWHYVAVTATGKILHTTTPMVANSWTQVVSLSAAFNAVIFDTYTKNFVAVSSAGSYVVAYSTNGGVNWSQGTINASFSQGIALASNGIGTIIAIAPGGTYTKAISADGGINWSVGTTGLGDMRCITFGNSIWVVGASTGTTSSIRYSIDNGVNWVAVTAPTTQNLKGACFSGNVFLMCTDSGTTQQCIKSYDAKIWTPITTIGSGKSYIACCYSSAGSIIVIANNGATTDCMVSF
jgi:hypothetical protein